MILRAAAGLLLSLLSAWPATAQQPAADAEPRPGTPVADDDFRVTTRAFGLERRVEMYQWRRDGDRYVPVWNEALIDSSGFAPGHENPTRVPLRSRRWWTRDATFDGRPLDDAVLRSLGQWRVFRPSFSRLPGNLSATFQPEGDGLGSAENPLDPQIGDLRVTWRELVLPPLAGRVTLRGGAWVPTRAASEAIARAPTAVVLPEPEPEPEPTQRLWPWFAGIALLVVALFIARQRRHRRQAAAPH